MAAPGAPLTYFTDGGGGGGGRGSVGRDGGLRDFLGSKFLTQRFFLGL